MTSISLSFLRFFIVLPKTALFINLRKNVSKSCFALFLRYVFISIYGFSQAFWLNLITLWTNPWFNACFKFLMWIIFSVLLCKLPTNFSTFSIFILFAKIVNHCEGHVIFQDIEHQLHWNIVHYFLCYSFFIKFALNWKISSIHSKLFTGMFFNIAHPYKLFTSQHWIYDGSLFLL